MAKEQLYEDYINKGLSTRDIAKKYGISQTQVRRLMQRYNIQARSASERTNHFKEKMKPIYQRYSNEYKQYSQNICEYCGKPFDVNWETRNKKLCSPECLSNSKKKPLTIYYCEICGNEIKNINGRNYKRKYCKSCRDKGISLTQYKRIKTKCGYCGKEIEVIPSVFNKNKFCYCSEDCMGKNYKVLYTGENSPTWNGGEKHYQGNWFQARDTARERDEYKCQICGKTEYEIGKQLDVHHIKPYKSFDDKFEANKIDNLICLCYKCHSFIHSNKNKDKKYIK